MIAIKALKTEYKINPIGLGVAQPRLSWQLEADGMSIMQQAYRIKVANSPESLQSATNLLWDSEAIDTDQSIHIEYAGTTLQSYQKVYWQVEIWTNTEEHAVSEVASWQMGILSTDAWQAEWITHGWPADTAQSSPVPYFKKTITLSRKVTQATWLASARGLYELTLNGQKVGDEVFAPGWTNYRERIQYQAYDVTSALQQGENELGALVGDGWYRGHFGWWPKNRNTYGEEIALIAQLVVVYEDGSTELFCTDDSWQSATGPILKSDIYNGETYDATKAFAEWQKVRVLDLDKKVLVATEGEKVKKIQELVPQKLITTPAGEKVFDLGQNMVGWVRLKVAGPKGQTVKIQFAEVLDQAGNFYIDNLRGIECTEYYTLSGNGEEVYEPKFTFHGFRYVKVEGYPGELTKDSITGIVVHSDMEPTGDFECSEPLINQLQSNIQWGQKGNFLDVPTDCPQRDERLGWTGDAQVFAPTASFNFNTAPFFTKWLKDLTTEQKPDGSVPWVVPNNIVDGGGTGWSDGFGATGWADAAVVIPWTLYQYYGDKRILKEQFGSMKAWVDYMRHHAADRYIFDYGFHFGDWLSFAEYESYNYNAPDYGFAGAHTDKALIATAYFYYSATLLKKIAILIGEEEEAKSLAALLPKIKEAWNEEFMTRTGRLVSSTQAAYAIGLMFGIVADDKVAIIAQRLADDVSYFGHLTTGFLGTPVLNYALSDFGHLPLAYQLMNNTRYPSWLYSVTKGATTIWERWDGIRPDGSFQTVGMNSFNHYAYGAIGEWLYSRVAGLKLDEANPGYKNIIFEPMPGGGLTFAHAKINTMYGQAAAKWTQRDDATTYEVTVPANATGLVKIKPADVQSVMINGEPAAQSELVRKFRVDAGQVQFEIGSGAYTVVYQH